MKDLLNEETLKVYQQDVRSQIKELKGRMQIIDASIKAVDADRRIKYQENLNFLHSRVADVEERLVNLSASTIDERYEIKTGIDHAMADLQNAINGTVRHIEG